MTRLIPFIVFLLGSAALFAQNITPVGVSWIDEIKQKKNDTLYVINFWATWCKPCVEELPAFENLNTKYKNQKVKVILVSNDMKKDVDTRLKQFVANKKMETQVVWMSEVNADKWINKVNPQWSGAIPATWLVKNSIGFGHFREGEMTEQDLNLLIEQTIDLH